MSEQETELKEDEESKEDEEKTAFDEAIDEVEKEYSEVVKVNDKWTAKAKDKIPDLVALLEAEEKEGVHLSKKDIYQIIMQRCRQYWGRSTILDALPEHIKSIYQKEEIQGISEPEGNDSGSLTETTSSENPQEDEIKKLKQQLKQEQKSRTDAQRLYQKLNEKQEKRDAEMKEIREQLKTLKQSQKLLDIFEPIYDKKLNAITVTVTGVSNTKLQKWAEDTHAKDINRKTELTLKFDSKGKASVDSIN